MRSRATAPFGKSALSSSATRLALLALFAAAFLLVPAANACAEVIVNLDGTGTGTVTSDKTGFGGQEIECSNTGGGAPGPRCSEEFTFEEVKLTATPGSNSVFVGWTGDDPGPEILGFGTCNSGGENPCEFVDPESYGFGTAHITATFKATASLPPDVTTEGTSPGANELLTALEGTVNPGGFEVDGCRFEYGPTTNYAFQAPCIPDASGIGEGSTPVSVHGEAELEELKPSTTYHYRIVATNFAGSAKGEDRTFTTGPPPSEDELPASDQGCENKQIREAQTFGAILLPDCMALEMVSPPQKGGQAAKAPGLNGALSASADGNRVIFSSVAALGGTPGPLNAEGDQYVATRGESGWAISPTSPPVDIVGGWAGFAVALSYTPDFSSWFQLGSTRSQYQQGMGRVFQAGLGGIFTPISPLFTPRGGGEKDDVKESRFQGASADHSHLYFIPGHTRTAYLPGDPEPSGKAADRNTYVAHLDSGGQPSLELLARDSADRVWGGACGARLGGVRPVVLASSDPTGERNQGAVSEDGRRVYFSTRPDQPKVALQCSNENKLRILERLESKAQGVHIEELFSSECSRPDCSSADGNDYYQGASIDQTKVYFTTTRQLADSDLDEGAGCSFELGESEGCDLYLYDSTLPPGQRLIQVSAGGAGDPTPGEGANVLNGVTAISGDGSRVYFVAQGVLTTDPNPEGEEAQAGQPNLYVWDRNSEETAFIGSLDSGDDPIWNKGGNLGGLLAVPELGDGHVLTFESRAALSANDDDGAHRDVLRYDAEGEEIECVSCIGASDSAPFDVSRGGGSDSRPAGTNFATLGTDSAERGRQVGEDGETIVFATDEALVPGDANGARDGYLWREGELYRLPGQFPTASSIGISGYGSTIAFSTPTELLLQDGDTASDVYAARAGGGYAQAEEAAPCQSDESLPGKPCQEKQSEPLPPSVGSPPPGTKNVQPSPPSCPKRKRKVRRKGKVRCVAKHARKPHRARNANANRRTAK